MYGFSQPNKEDNFESYKNFRIVHNSSQNSSNMANLQNYNSHKTESSLNITEGDQQSMDPIIKESSKHISKITQMLEEHRKKKAMKPINDTLESINNSNPRLTKEYIIEMREKLNRRLRKIYKQQSNNFSLTYCTSRY
jgi:hypothetical protein